METYVSMLENYLTNLGLPLVPVTLGVIVTLLLVTALALIRAGRQASQLASEKAKSTTDLMQASQNLQAAHSQVEQFQLQARQRLQTLRGLMTDFNALNVVEAADDLATLPEDVLWEKHAAMLLELSEKFKSDEAKIVKLQQQNHEYKSHLDQLELARMATFNDLNLAKQKISQMEPELDQASSQLALAADKIQQLEAELDGKRQQFMDNAQNLERLQEEHSGCQANLVKHEQSLKQAESQLALAVDRVLQLETELDGKNQQQQNNQASSAQLQTDFAAAQAEITRLKQEHDQTLDELRLTKQKITELEKSLNVRATQPEPAIQSSEDGKPLGRLFSKFINTVKPDLNRGSQAVESTTAAPSQASIDANALAEKDALIAKLQAELAAQQYHIDRLARDIEAQQEQQATRSRAQETPNSGGEQPSSATSVNPLEGFLANAKLSALSGAFEKLTQRAPEPKQLLEPVKEQVEETVSQGKHLPEQLKNLYRKLNPFK